MEQRGLADEAWWRGRQDDYLAAAVQVWIPGSILNVIDHLEHADRTGATVALDDLTPAVLDTWFHRIDGWLDCADFDILRLLNLWPYRDRLPTDVVAEVQRRFLNFTYWYDDPHPDGVVDQRWYWSENHRLIFHTCEYLAGELLADATFTVTGLTGAQHRDRALSRIAAWFDEKAVDGFSEWHSDVYYAKDLAPLVTLAELADDPTVAERAATFLDLLLFDLALHQHRGNTGCTHGRSYMKNKPRAVHQPVFGAVKLCFATTDAPWPLEDGSDTELLSLQESATLLARTQRWRPPEAIRRVGASRDEVLDREHFGTAIDPSEPLAPDPVRTDGLSYTDPAMVPFWWDRGALTPWQVVPLTLATLDRHRLWPVPLFAEFAAIRGFVGDDLDTWRRLAADLHPMVNAGLLTEVETVTWRDADGMLSTALDYRPGCTGFQHHVWQATLDEQAVVFTVHPGNEPSPDVGDYLDNDRYWTGSATLPRSVQHHHVGVHAYSPGFADPGTDGPLSAFHYEPYTHAFFPTDHFDEVVRHERWTVGRRGDGYVALWSWRQPEWRHHDPATTFVDGLEGPFDLVADGGADNVWIVELGSARRSGGFHRFLDAVAGASIDVHDRGWADTGPHGGFDVTYASPSLGELRWGSTGPLVVDGAEQPVDAGPRFDNRFTRVERGDPVVPITAGDATWVLDLATGTRGPA